MIDIVTPAKDVFINKESEGCPITSCSLMMAGCKEAYAGDDLSISKLAPFTVKTI